jgi:type 1 fimbriae regulatory protein FimB
MEYLAIDELRTLLEAARKESERDWLLILVAFWHGLRATEAITLRVSDVRDGYITIARLKGSLRTVQQLMEHSDKLLDEKAGLTAWIEGKAGNTKLFPITRQHFGRIMHRHCAAAGIPAHKSNPHVLKHSCAHYVIKAGIQVAQQHLGHKSLSSTGEYLRITDATASAAVQALARGRQIA